MTSAAMGWIQVREPHWWRKSRIPTCRGSNSRRGDRHPSAMPPRVEQLPGAHHLPQKNSRPIL
uniref:Uncharacterized protein n=1 Tax=Arundo donax TaxID=35708 RepID=A0A0A9AB19_ARUDO